MLLLLIQPSLRPSLIRIFALFSTRTTSSLPYAHRKAIQILFAQDALENIDTCFDIYTYHQAIPRPDPTRHPLQAEFLREIHDSTAELPRTKA
jgi:hypothetical protein